MKFFNPLAWMSSPYDDADKQNRTMQNAQNLHDSQTRANNERVARMRQEEYRRALQNTPTDIAPLPGGTVAPPVTPSAFSAAPAQPEAAPPAPARGQGKIDKLRQDEYRRRNVTPPTGGDQSDAENKRLASKVPPSQRYIPGDGGVMHRQAKEAQRLAELRAKNPMTVTPGDETAAEANRLLGQPAPAPAGGDKSVPRGLRNNNPGNIEYGPFARSMGATGSDGRFAIFPDAASGEAAADRLLQTYHSKHGLDTVAGVVGRWSPQADPTNKAGSTNAYTDFVARKLGVSPNTQLDMNNPEVRRKLAMAKFEFENGRPYAPATAQPAPAAPTQVAQAAPPSPAAQPAPAAPMAPSPATPAMQFTPEQITAISQESQVEMRRAQMQLQEATRLLQSAPDVQTAAALQSRVLEIRLNAHSAQLADALAKAASGDEQSVSQLATAAGVTYARTPQGYVTVQLDPNSGNFTPTSQPFQHEVFINEMFARATGAAQAQAQQMALEQRKHMYAMQLEELKGRNKLLEVDAKAQAAIGQLLTTRQLQADDVANISSHGGEMNPKDKKIIVTFKDGRIAMLESGKDLGNGMVSAPRLVPIS
jgi:hypothetical protein